MDAQCDGCGGFDGIQECARCFAPICTRCSYIHDQACERVQRKKALGLGPTVREINRDRSPNVYVRAVPEKPRVEPTPEVSAQDTLDKHKDAVNECIQNPGVVDKFAAQT